MAKDLVYLIRTVSSVERHYREDREAPKVRINLSSPHLNQPSDGYPTEVLLIPDVYAEHKCPINAGTLIQM